MISKAPYGLSPSFALTINNASVDYHSLMKLEVELSESKHDMLTIDIGGIPPRAITDYQNKAVSLSVSTGANYSFSFTGYVVVVHPVSKTFHGLVNDSPFQTASIVCLGASYVMRGKKNRVWETHTLADVAQEMCTHYGFSLDVPSDPLIFSPLAQVQESDWQFIVRYSEMLGYKVNLHGTHMHIYDPHRAADRGTSFNKLTTIRATQGNMSPAPGQISSFRGSFTENTSDNDTITTVRQGLSEFDVASSGDTEQSTKIHNHINGHLDNYENAMRFISTSRKSTYDYRANATVSGLAGCLPGGVVALDNYNSNFDGLWYVQEVKHSLSSGAFVTDLVLARNKQSELTEVVNVQKYTAPPTPRYVAGKWEATKKVLNAY